MNHLIQATEAGFTLKKLPAVRSGDTVKVHQRVREGAKERVQVFEGTVIGVKRPGSPTYSITVRRMASGVGVEKSFLLQSTSIAKLEVTKRSPKNKNKLNYLRKRQGKSARLAGFDHFEMGAEEEKVEKEDETEAPTAETKTDEAKDAKSDKDDKPAAEKETKADAASAKKKAPDEKDTDTSS